jgi:hypothetical protein
VIYIYIYIYIYIVVYIFNQYNNPTAGLSLNQLIDSDAVHPVGVPQLLISLRAVAVLHDSLTKTIALVSVGRTEKSGGGSGGAVQPERCFPPMLPNSARVIFLLRRSCAII